MDLHECQMVPDTRLSGGILIVHGMRIVFPRPKSIEFIADGDMPTGVLAEVIKV